MNTDPPKNTAINIITLGCSKNTVDSEFLLKQLKSNYRKVFHNAKNFEAKTVIINTCGFIKDAKQESIDTILQFVKAKEENLIDHLFVIGCLSQRYKDDLQKEIPQVDKYLGVNNIKEVIHALGTDYNKENANQRILSTPNHYAYLKTSEGCNRTCSFCIIPKIRGKYKSKPIEDLIAESEFLSKQGVKEIILIAQDLSYYGTDIYRKQMLPELLKKLSDSKLFEWIRIHYIYPSYFPKEVLAIMNERENICNYLDIPFQHINNKVLKMMRRGYTKNEVESLVSFFRNEIPGIVLRTTLLVGHPGEGKREFEELKNFVQTFEFDRLGVFTYSEEEGTHSERNYTDRTPERTKQIRADEIMKIQYDISKRLNERKIGKTMNVIIDRKDSGNYIGRSEGDSPEVDNEIIITTSSNKKKNLHIGQFYNVKITSAEAYDLYAEVINE